MQLGRGGRAGAQQADGGEAADWPEGGEAPARPTEPDKGQALAPASPQFWPQRHRVHLLEARKKVLDQRRPGRAGTGLLQTHAPGAVLTFSPCQVWAWPAHPTLPSQPLSHRPHPQALLVASK